MYARTYTQAHIYLHSQIHSLTCLLCQSESLERWHLNWCKHSMFKGSVLILKKVLVTLSITPTHTYIQTYTHSWRPCVKTECGSLPTGWKFKEKTPETLLSWIHSLKVCLIYVRLRVFLDLLVRGRLSLSLKASEDLNPVRYCKTLFYFVNTASPRIVFKSRPFNALWTWKKCMNQTKCGCLLGQKRSDKT